MKVEIIEISDLTKFKYVEGNRDIDAHHVQTLVKSISKKNMLSIRPVLCSSDFEVIDGQHRIEACKELGIPVYCIFSDELDHEDIIALNNTQKPWKFINFFNFHLIKKRHGFDIIHKFSQKNGIKIDAALMLHSDTGQKNLLKVKHGEVSLGNHHNAQRIFDMAKDYEKYASNTWYSFEFLLAIRKMYNNEDIAGISKGFIYNHKYVMSFCSRTPEFNLRTYYYERRISSIQVFDSVTSIFRTIKHIQDAEKIERLTNFLQSKQTV